MTRPEFHALRKGDAVPVFTFSVSADEVHAYLDATGGSAEVWGRAVPPLALAALTLAGLMDEIPLPAGAVHVSQELESVQAVEHGDMVEARLTIAQQSVRQGTNVVVFAIELWTDAGVALRGRTTVMAPLPSGNEGVLAAGPRA
jgi:hypothetical protein